MAILFVDGLIAYIAEIGAMRMYLDRRLFLIEEEEDTSRVDQAFRPGSLPRRIRQTWREGMTVAALVATTETH